MKEPQRAPIPTVHHPALGMLGFYADNTPPWVGSVPERLRPAEAEPKVDIYLPGDAMAPDAGCLSHAADAVLNLPLLNRDCQRLLAEQPDSHNKEWSLNWLEFARDKQGSPDSEAVYVGGFRDPMDFDIYVLWIVKVRENRAHSLRISYW